MVSIYDAAKEFYLDSFVTTTKNDSYNYIINGQSENSTSEWSLYATDGHNIWKLILTKQQLESMIASRSLQQYFSDFRNLLDADKLRIDRTNDVKLFTDDGKVNLILKQVDESVKAKELSSLLFQLANRIKTLTKQVKEQPKRSSEPRGMYDQPLTNLDAHKKRGQNKFRHREGMSLLNPSSKKVKTAKGIDFE